MYRLAADVFNDTAMILDCLSPALPKALRVVLLSFSSVLRALCGVAAGSSKASLSAHFAKWGNLGELNAVSPPFYFPGGYGMGRNTNSCFPTTPILSSLGYDLRSCFLRIAVWMSTEGQAEGLEPRDRNLANRVRTIRSLFLRVTASILILSQAEPIEQNRGIFSFCMLPRPVP